MSDQVKFEIVVSANNAVKALGNFNKAVNKAVNSSTAALAKLDKSMDKITANMRTMNSMKMTGFASGLREANTQARALEKRMKSINASSQKSVGGGGGGRKSNGSGGGGMFGGSLLNGAMGMMGGLGAYAALNVMKDMFKTGVDFEYNMKQIQVILGETDKSFASLGSTIEDVASNSSFKLSEVGLSAKVLAKAGWGLDKIKGSLESISNLGVSANISAESAADMVSTVSNIWGIEKNFDGITDVMTATVNGFKTSVSDLGMAYQYTGALASKAGYSFLDTNVAIGTLQDNGIKASKAGTAMRSFFTELIAPKTKSLELIDKYNLSLTKTVDGITELKSFDETLPQLAKMSTAEMKDMFGKVAYAPIGILVDEYMSGDFEKARAKIATQVGITAAQKTEMLDTTRGSLDLLSASWENLSNKSFEAVDGKNGLIDLLTRLTNATGDFIEEFDEFQESSEELAIKDIKDDWVDVGAAINDATGYLASFFSIKYEPTRKVRKYLQSLDVVPESMKPTKKPERKYTEEEKKYWTMRGDADPKWKGKYAFDNFNWGLNGKPLTPEQMADTSKRSLWGTINKPQDLYNIGEKKGNIKLGTENEEEEVKSAKEILAGNSPLSSVANEFSRSIVVNIHDGLLHVENQYIGSSNGELGTDDIERQLSDALIHIVSDYELSMSN